MARMPGAAWRPLAANWADQPRMTVVDLVVVHTMVGSLAGTESYFRSGNGAGFSGTESHFGTGSDGTIWQWQDTDRRAEANLNGNWHIISIENADYGPGFGTWNTQDGSQVPAFTAAQIEANARIVAWAHQVHGIPIELVPDSKPGRRGVGYHRLGCDPYRVEGGEKWSNAYGKVCPGNRRIAQIPQIITRARQIVGQEEDELNDIQARQLAQIHAALPKITFLYDLFTRQHPSGVEGSDVTGTLTSFIRWADTHAYYIRREELPELRRLIAELSAKVDPGP